MGSPERVSAVLLSADLREWFNGEDSEVWEDRELCGGITGYVRVSFPAANLPEPFLLIAFVLGQFAHRKSQRRGKIANSSILIMRRNL